MWLSVWLIDRKIVCTYFDNQLLTKPHFKTCDCTLSEHGCRYLWFCVSRLYISCIFATCGQRDGFLSFLSFFLSIFRFVCLRGDTHTLSYCISLSVFLSLIFSAWFPLFRASSHRPLLSREEEEDDEVEEEEEEEEEWRRADWSVEVRLSSAGGCKHLKNHQNPLISVVGELLKPDNNFQLDWRIGNKVRRKTGTKPSNFSTFRSFI